MKVVRLFQILIILNDNRYESSEKDILISQLKSQIFELEQNEKNFNALNHKFKNIQNE